MNADKKEELNRVRRRAAGSVFLFLTLLLASFLSAFICVHLRFQSSFFFNTGFTRGGVSMLLAQFWVPEQASESAGDIDSLAGFVTLVTGSFTLLIAVLVIYFGIKYRRRSESDVPPKIKGSLRLEIGWTIPPLVIGLAIFFWSARLYVAAYRPPDDAMTVYVVAKQWMWKTQQPGGQREINALHVPLGQAVRLSMISEDVIHSFYVPAFRMKQDVLPGRYTSIWFRPTKEGTYNLFCAEYCGTEHSLMRGKIYVLKPGDYQTWLEGEAKRAPDGSAALKGRQLFLRGNRLPDQPKVASCIACHYAGTQLAPLLENLYGSMVRLDDGSIVRADDAYIRRSILDPRSQVVAGFRPIMPTFKGQLSEDEILQLIAFIRSLKTGDTPPRVENTEPPTIQPEKK
jgi:cytochrome c oxidase subunit II